MSAAGGSIRVEAATSSRKAEVSELQRESCLWTGITLTILGVFAALAVYSWTPGDGWAFVHAGASATAGHNLAGAFGNWLGTHLLGLYGFSAYLLPPTLLAWGIFLISKRSMQGQWMRLAGCFVLLTCLMLMSGAFGQGAKGDAGSELPYGAGGVAGSVVLAPALTKLLGSAGTVFFGAVLLVGSLYLIWAGFVLSCARGLMHAFAWAGQTSAAAVVAGKQAMAERAAANQAAALDAEGFDANDPEGVQVPAITGPQPALGQQMAKNTAPMAGAKPGAHAAQAGQAGANAAQYQQRVVVGSMSGRHDKPKMLTAEKHVATDDFPATAAAPAKPAPVLLPGQPVAALKDADSALFDAETIDTQPAPGPMGQASMANQGSPFDLPTDCLDLPVTAKQAHRAPPAIEISEVEIAWETHKRQEQHLEDDGESVEEIDALIAIAREAESMQSAGKPAADKTAKAGGAAAVEDNDSADSAEIVQTEATERARGLKVKKHDSIEAERKAVRAEAKKKGKGAAGADGASEDREPGDLAIADPNVVPAENGEGEGAGKPGLRSHPKLKWANYQHPSFDLLHTPIGQKSIDEVVLRERGRKLTMMLARYGVDVNVVKIIPGPSLTTYEVKLAATTTASEVQKREKEMALELMVEAVRITPPIAGRGTIGIEVPNHTAENIVLREIMETDSYGTSDCALPIVIGKDSLGKPLILDLAKSPHMLMAGATGMGKSVGLNAILLSILMCKKPWEVKMLMIDPKAVELDIFNDIPHMMHPIVTDMAKAKKLLDFCVWEMDRRYKLMRACRVRNIREYNALDHAERCNRFVPGELDLCDLTPYLPYLVLVVEEWADLYNTNKEEAVEPVQRIAQKARAAGVHMILTTQNPTVKCLPGLIKSNVPTRLAYRVGQRIDSQVILDAVGAEKLVHRGEFLLKNVEGRMTRGQGAYVSTEEVERVADYLRSQGAPEYDQDIQEAMSEGCDDGAKEEAIKDKLFFQAVDLLLTEQRASTSILQRRMGIGYNRAARLVDLMHKLNIVGPVNGAKPRDILVTTESWAELKAELMGKAAAGGAVINPGRTGDEYADFEAENAVPVQGREGINGDESNDEIADDNGGEKY